MEQGGHLPRNEREGRDQINRLRLRRGRGSLPPPAAPACALRRGPGLLGEPSVPHPGPSHRHHAPSWPLPVGAAGLATASSSLAARSLDGHPLISFQPGLSSRSLGPGGASLTPEVLLCGPSTPFRPQSVYKSRVPFSLLHRVHGRQEHGDHADALVAPFPRDPDSAGSPSSLGLLFPDSYRGRVSGGGRVEKDCGERADS